MLAICRKHLLKYDNNNNNNNNNNYIIIMNLTKDLHSGVMMSGDVRLVGDTLNGQGAVEILTTQGYRTICPDSTWTDSVATIICQNLGYESGQSIM